MTEKNPRTGIIFLPVPDTFRQPGAGHNDAELHHDHHGEAPDFAIDPDIPIPVEISAQHAAEFPAPRENSKRFDPEDLSWEMILSGMLKILSLPPDAGCEFEKPDAANIPHEKARLLPARFADIQASWFPYYRRFVLALRPGILGEFTEAAILKTRNGDYDTALEILAALGGLFPRSPAVLLNTALVLEDRAESLERSGREEEAEEETRRALEAYTQVLALEPPLPGALFNAGFFFMKTRNFKKAKECFSAFIPLADDSEKKDQAQSLVREISSQNLDDAVFREARELIRSGRENEGIQKARNFLERNSGAWNGWFTLGWGLRRLERWADGEAAFRKALELGGDNADTRNELAICLMEQGRLTEARKELEGALRKDSENIKIISNLGILALKSGSKDEADAFFRTVLELEPEDPIALKFLGGQEQ
ncbi:MAG: tetratricopeptide repeat protein [Spirochaetaceae bacterium]|nr:tetratricopeptide repeat protein [Spirochaetaceae bacterium]